jgi:hypothetical protein
MKTTTKGKITKADRTEWIAAYSACPALYSSLQMRATNHNRGHAGTLRRKKQLRKAKSLRAPLATDALNAGARIVKEGIKLLALYGQKIRTEYFERRNEDRCWSYALHCVSVPTEDTRSRQKNKIREAGERIARVVGP